jgi:hypothetical protein
MTTDQPKDFLDTLAKIVTLIFHPLLMPVYGMAIILSAPTLYGYLPFTVKKLIILIMLVNNVLLPLSLLPFFIHMNIISSWTISERRERNIPLAITTLLYCTTAFIFFRFPVPVFLKSFIYASAFLSLMVTLINFRLKISLHSVGAGALVALVIILSFKMYTPLIWYLISSVIAGGLVLSSRLKLNYHNPYQVWSGFFTGFVGLSLIMLFF